MERVVERGNELISKGLKTFASVDLDGIFGELRLDLFKQNRIEKVGLYKAILKGKVSNKLKENVLNVEHQVCTIRKLKDLGFKNIRVQWQKGIIRAHWEGRRGASSNLIQIFPGMKKFSGDLPYGDHIFDIASMLDKLTPEHVDKITEKSRIIRKELIKDRNIVGIHIAVSNYQFKQLEKTDSNIVDLNERVNKVGLDMIIIPLKAKAPKESLKNLMNKCRK